MPFIPLEVYANNPSTTVSSGGTTAPAGGTVETWTVASSAAFPAVEVGATQFHVADPAQPSEMITVQNVSGTTWTVARGAESSTPAAHAAGFTVVQVVTAGALTAARYEPWQFLVQAYGAQGDGKIGTGGTGTSGTNTFTDAGASFVNAAAPAGDVGKVIIINQGTSGSGTLGGTNQNPFCGTITAVNSATSVTLSGNLAATCANAPYIYGTDDSAAISAAVSAAATWATSTGNYKAQVMFEPQNYMLGALTQTISPYKYNTHIQVPIGAQYGRKLCIDFIGVGDASEPDYWESTVPCLQGTCLVSAVWTASQPDATYGQMSVIGGPTDSTGMSPGGFANTLVNFSGLTIVCPWNSQQFGVDGRNLAQMNVPNGSYLAFAPVNFSGQAVGGPYLYQNNIVSNGVSVGFHFPWWNNNDNNNAGYITAEGAAYGIAVTEHFYAERMGILYCNAALQVPTISGQAKHGAEIGYFSAEGCNYCIAATSATAGGVYPVFIGNLDTEYIQTAQVLDANNVLTGTVYWANADTLTNFVTVSGAQNLQIIDISKHFPGKWTGAPAAPSSGTAQQNTAYRLATIYASATTSITSIAIGPASGSLASITVTQGAGQAIPIRVPPGFWYSVTYSGTLTTTWVLE